MVRYMEFVGMESSDAPTSAAGIPRRIPPLKSLHPAHLTPGIPHPTPVMVKTRRGELRQYWSDGSLRRA